MIRVVGHLVVEVGATGWVSRTSGWAAAEEEASASSDVERDPGGNRCWYTSKIMYSNSCSQTYCSQTYCQDQRFDGGPHLSAKISISEQELGIKESAS